MCNGANSFFTVCLNDKEMARSFTTEIAVSTMSANTVHEFKDEMIYFNFFLISKEQTNKMQML